MAADSYKCAKPQYTDILVTVTEPTANAVTVSMGSIRNLVMKASEAEYRPTGVPLRKFMGRYRDILGQPHDRTLYIAKGFTELDLPTGSEPHQYTRFNCARQA